MKSIEEKVRQSIEQHSLLQIGERPLVAYSGGPDSTCLLLLLSKLCSDTAAVYVNHHLRGDESEQEELFVRKFCADRNLPLFVEQMNWNKPPSNLEEKARKRRYRHFQRVAIDQKFDKVALAHHKDDVTETFLFRLIRGSGPSGLAGMAWRRGIFIRPLLNCSHQEILQFLHEQGANYFTDSSNSDMAFRRNRIRHELIPLIEEMNPKFTESIVRTSHWISEQNELVEQLLDSYDDMMQAAHVDRKQFLRLSPPLRKALLRRWILRSDPNLAPSARLLEQLIDAIAQKENLELPGFLMVESRGETFAISRKSGSVGYCEVDVPSVGTYSFPPGNVRLNFSTEHGSRFQTATDVACLDADKASFPLYIRNWKKGDFFYPLGMNGHKKLSDFLIDKKVPRSERKRIPLVFKDDDLIWVAGYQIDHRYRVTENTGEMLRIQISKNV